LLGLDVDIDVRRELSGYSVAIQQMVAIARAINISARVLILDEPTSSLDGDEVRKLFETLRRLRTSGMAILFVTHFLDQVYAISDRITVLRNGRLVGEHRAVDLDQAALIAAMVGRAVPAGHPSGSGAAPPTGQDAAADCVLRATGLERRGGVSDVSFEVGRGEILGLAGLLGSGRTEVARLLFGLDRADTGELVVNGAAVVLKGPAHAVAHRLGFCPEERKTEGIVEDLSIRDNIILTLQA